jgi:hypothetical protein
MHLEMLLEKRDQKENQNLKGFQTIIFTTKLFL